VRLRVSEYDSDSGSIQNSELRVESVIGWSAARNIRSIDGQNSEQAPMLRIEMTLSVCEHKTSN
jgi:hypothetical protein